MSLAEELEGLLVALAHERIDAAAYTEAHWQAVLVALSQFPAQFTSKLPFYCLSCDDHQGQKISELAFDYLLLPGEGPEATEQRRQEVAERRQEILELLRMEFDVLDELNSVPWSYGLRTRSGSDAFRFTPLIAADVPINPGRAFSRGFRTTVEAQEWVRLELLVGGPGEATAGAYELRLLRRLRLPRPLPKGHPVHVRLERAKEAALRLSIEIPGAAPAESMGRPETLRWSLEDDLGFQDLAAAVRAKPRRSDDEPGPLLVAACLNNLANLKGSLPEHDAKSLAEWAVKTSEALVRRNKVSLKSALMLLLRELQGGEKRSVIVLLDAFLSATRAPVEVMAEFNFLAGELLRADDRRGGEPEGGSVALPAGEAAAVLIELWTMVEQWRRGWEGAGRGAGLDPSAGQGVEVLLDLLGDLRRVVDRISRPHEAHAPGSPHDVAFTADLTSLREAAVKRMRIVPTAEIVEGKWKGYSAALADLVREIDLLLDPESLPFYPDARISSLEPALYRTLTYTLAFLFHETRTPGTVAFPIRSLARRITSGPATDVDGEAREQLLELVSGWHGAFKQRGEPLEPEVGLQVQVLEDLVDALNEPEITDGTVERILDRRRFDTGALQTVATALRFSSWFQAAPAKARQSLDQQLETIHSLDAHWQQEDRYHLKTALRLLLPHKDAFPDEAHAVLAALEAAARFIEPGTVPPRPGPAAEPAPAEEPPELRELLEPIPAD